MPQVVVEVCLMMKMTLLRRACLWCVWSLLLHKMMGVEGVVVVLTCKPRNLLGCLRRCWIYLFLVLLVAVVEVDDCCSGACNDVVAVMGMCPCPF